MIKRKNVLIGIVILFCFLIIGFFFFKYFTITGNAIYSQGDGSLENPYVITSCTELQAMNQDLGANYVLGNNINCSETREWNCESGTCLGFEPVGKNSSVYFNGSLDGQGFNISGLYIDRTSEDYVGLFGYIDSGDISNLRFIDIKIAGRSYVGGLAGRHISGEINNLYFLGNVSGWSAVGGLLGWQDGNITNIHIGINLNCSSNSCGGISGEVRGVISNSLAEVNIFGGQYTGGIAGINSGTINNSNLEGNISASLFVGGIAGSNKGRIIKSYFNEGTLKGSYYLGGVVGSNWGSIENSYYNYNKTEILDIKMITIGALFEEDFNKWINGSVVLEDYFLTDGGYYLIKGVSDFKKLLLFGQNASSNFKLINDIDLSNETNFFIPYFAGKLDGNNKTINNLNINQSSTYLGTIGYLTGEIYNLTLKNISVQSLQYVSHAGGLAGLNKGNISELFSYGNVTGKFYVGGLVGSNYGSIYNSTSRGFIEGFNKVGGMVGENFGEIYMSISESQVFAGSSNVGGFVGQNGGMIYNSFFLGNVSGDREVGGFSGAFTPGSEIANSYAFGNVFGNSLVGSFSKKSTSAYEMVSNSYAITNLGFACDKEEYLWNSTNVNSSCALRNVGLNENLNFSNGNLSFINSSLSFARFKINFTDFNLTLQNSNLSLRTSTWNMNNSYIKDSNFTLWLVDSRAWLPLINSTYKNHTIFNSFLNGEYIFYNGEDENTISDLESLIDMPTLNINNRNITFVNSTITIMNADPNFDMSHLTLRDTTWRMINISRFKDSLFRLSLYNSYIDLPLVNSFVNYHIIFNSYLNFTNETTSSYGYYFYTGIQNPLIENYSSIVSYPNPVLENHNLTFKNYSVLFLNSNFTALNSSISLLNSGLFMNAEDSSILNSDFNLSALDSYVGISSANSKIGYDLENVLYGLNYSLDSMFFIPNITSSGSNLSELVSYFIDTNFNEETVFFEGTPKRYVVDSSRDPNFNKSADIEFDFVGFRIFNSKILRNGEACNNETNPPCFNLTPLDGGLIKFNVSLWSEYGINGTFERVCGSGVLDLNAGEVCDGSDFGGLTCASYGNFNQGSLSCSSDCREISSSGCYYQAPVVDGGSGGGSGGSGSLGSGGGISGRMDNEPTPNYSEDNIEDLKTPEAIAENDDKKSWFGQYKNVILYSAGGLIVLLIFVILIISLKLKKRENYLKDGGVSSARTQINNSLNKAEEFLAENRKREASEEYMKMKEIYEKNKIDDKELIDRILRLYSKIKD